MIKSFLIATTVVFSGPDNVETNPLASMVYVYSPAAYSPAVFQQDMLIGDGQLVPFGLNQDLPVITESEGVYAANVLDYRDITTECVGCEASHRWVVNMMDPFNGGVLNESDLQFTVANGRNVAKHATITGVMEVIMIASVNGKCIRDKNTDCVGLLNCSFAYRVKFTPANQMKSYKIDMVDETSWPRYVSVELHDGMGEYTNVFFNTPPCGLKAEGHPTVKFVIFDNNLATGLPVVEYRLFLNCERCRNDIQTYR